MRIGRSSEATQYDDADLVLIGGGIMSATLASMMATEHPDSRVLLLEKATRIAGESSDPWNNAGTGHSGFCELNYMPDPDDPAKAIGIADQFRQTRQWWSRLAERGDVDPDRFLNEVPHMTVVFGEHDVDYLRRRFAALSQHEQFAGMEFSDDPATIASWAPLTAGTGVPIAATRMSRGTDVDFGSLTKQLVESSDCEVRLCHDVRTLHKQPDGRWLITGRDTENGHQFVVRAGHVFVGAGGMALRLLQRAKVAEVRGYGVLPVGAAFFRTADPDVVARHDVKMYGQAPTGAPPMSVPHLDKRIVDGRGYLMFGPYATFGTKLLKAGRFTDFFTTLRWHNLHVIAAALLQNLSLIGYLVGQLAASRTRKFRQLQRFYPDADIAQWELIAAGQRAQLVTPDRRRIGALQQGTELVVSADGSISGLLGASPGASTAVPIMQTLMHRCFPDE